jgi:hypothetical protein
MARSLDRAAEARVPKLMVSRPREMMCGSLKLHKLILLLHRHSILTAFI